MLLIAAQPQHSQRPLCDLGCEQVMQHGETVARVGKLESQAQTLRDSARQATAAMHAAQAAKVTSCLPLLSSSA